MLDEKLATLLAVAEEKNFTRAAKRLSLTQPAVSHHIALLEKEYGESLFLRLKGEVVPTAEGEIAIAYARRFIAMEQKMRTEIADSRKKLTKMRVGLTHTSESNRMTEILGKFSSERSGISITVITDTIKNLYDMLENYELDLAIVEGKVTRPDFYTLMLDTDYLVCVTAPGHPFAHQPMVTLAELKKEQMILRLPSSATRALFESTLASIGESIDDFNVILEVDNIATIKDLIRKEFGVSILAKSTCLDELRKGKLAVLPIENLSMVRETNMVYNKSFPHVDVLRDIVRLYQDELKA